MSQYWASGLASVLRETFELVFCNAIFPFCITVIHSSLLLSPTVSSAFLSSLTLPCLSDCLYVLPPPTHMSFPYNWTSDVAVWLMSGSNRYFMFFSCRMRSPEIHLPRQSSAGGGKLWSASGWSSAKVTENSNCLHIGSAGFEKVDYFINLGTAQPERSIEESFYKCLFCFTQTDIQHQWFKLKENLHIPCSAIPCKQEVCDK